MILSDTQIIDQQLLTNYDPEGLTPNGYDLRIAELRVNDQSYHEGQHRIPAGTPFFVASTERVNLINKAICGSLYIRSSFARQSCFISDGKVDAGFEGTLTIACIAFSDLKLDIGTRFVQIVFEQMSAQPTQQYSNRTGNYQNQTNVQLAKKS